MKPLLFLLLLCLSASLVLAQANPDETARIRQQITKIRKSANWNDPAAAKKANEEIQKLSKQISGTTALSSQVDALQTTSDDSVINVSYELKTAATKGNILAIAERYFKRSYKVLDGISKFQFDQDYKDAEKAKFSFEAVRKLTSTGGTLITFGNDHNFACVYLAAAVKAFPTDTLCINNFGGYLRIIDSIEASVPVLLYAYKLFTESPVIITQLGNSYFELHDLGKAESYFKLALKYDPDFSQAHASLCELYISQGKINEAVQELFAGVKGVGVSYKSASESKAKIKKAKEKAGKENEQSEMPKPSAPPTEEGIDYIPLVEIPNFPDCRKVADWTEGGGYAKAVESNRKFLEEQVSFAEKFNDAHTAKPSLPPNATLLNYGNARFMIESINEQFAKEAWVESVDYEMRMDDIRQTVTDAKKLYLNKLKAYNEALASCLEPCADKKGAEQTYCREDCERLFCTKECPSANQYNETLEKAYQDYRSQFLKFVKKQDEILDNLYSFAAPWIFSIKGQYWNKVYAYETKSVAMGIVGSCYAAYMQGFLFPAHNECGTDCSIFENPYPHEAVELNQKDPNKINCPQDKKVDITFLICGVSLDCESVEFGCSALLSWSFKKNFVNKSTTTFIGVGAELGVGVAKGEVKAGFTVTKSANGDIDVGVKGEATGKLLGAIGKNYEATVTVSEGLRTDAKDVVGFGL